MIVDTKLLEKQRVALGYTIFREDLPPDVSEYLEGLLELLHSIQDVHDEADGDEVILEML